MHALLKIVGWWLKLAQFVQAKISIIKKRWSVSYAYKKISDAHALLKIVGWGLKLA